MKRETYDVLIIGGGPAGYYCGLHCARGGLRVALVEKEELGGTGLRWGCLPVKNILDDLRSVINGKTYRHNRYPLIPEEGLQHYEKEMLVIEEKMKKKLLKANIDVYFGEGSFIDKNTYEIDNNTIKAKYVVIATGTKPWGLENLQANQQTIITHKEAVALEKLPGTIIIIGGNVEGCEFASLFAELGVKVVLVEKTTKLLEGNDDDLVKPLETYFKKRGIKIYKGLRATAIQEEEGKQVVSLNNGEKIKGDKVLVTVGRIPNFPKGMEKLGVHLEKDKIVVDNNLKTNITSIYAIGDINGILGMAHVAIQQGIAVADNILNNKNVIMNYKELPRAVFTIPEIAGVGFQEWELIEKKIPYRKGYYNFADTWRGFSKDIKEGFVKVLVAEDDKVLGLWMVGQDVSEYIGLMGLLIQKGVTCEEIKQNLIIHPSLSEAILEALLNVE
ncbi:dihydrolipoyl dehydrogenase family protein [Natronincola ferrireducens]|uniref:Dihydrolipoamide dehydrogenase n=1 Tax=Natronincola ferrireducens TaxID=393762 RepID=A0A1G9HCG3_9FIRM|nr:NAD(P)/FAD-dependent oxidoreductase [Natronincola ferrireducens]SDL10404.1 dihydrolipoamide dehydrogenase [Natronincola ferrireducens]